MFVDEIKLNLKAGKGGDGVERWLHEKFKEFMGPCGGDGGKGGDVFLEATRDLNILANYVGEKEFEAGDGEDGGTRSREGKNGQDFVLKVPVGTIATNLSTNQKFKLEEMGEKVKVLSGGNGGYGNEYFKSSRNTTPKETTPGKPGEEAEFLIEVELIADIGLIGFPNAGKSTMLNTFTNASSKIGAYPFTTLDPHLGVLFGLVLADLPGLIEGASGGKGLGHKFLRHIKKTKMLAHLVSVENENPLDSYKQIRKELEDYDKALLEKKEIVVLTKVDLISAEQIEKLVKDFSKENIEVKVFSALDDDLIKELQDFFVKELKK